jgi:hypothetical protein
LPAQPKTPDQPAQPKTADQPDLEKREDEPVKPVRHFKAAAGKTDPEVKPKIQVFLFYLLHLNNFVSSEIFSSL